VREASVCAKPRLPNNAAAYSEVRVTLSTIPLWSKRTLFKTKV
jgi:hypothetical protein